MSGMRKGSKQKTQALSSKTQNLGSSSSLRHPGSSSRSRSRPQFPLAPKRRNIIIEEKEDEIVDWMAHSSSQSWQDDMEVTSRSETMPWSQESQCSSCSSSFQPQRSLSVASSLSPLPPPSVAPSFFLRRGHQTSSHTLADSQESLPVDNLCESRQRLDCSEEEVEEETGNPMHSCIDGSSSGTCIHDGGGSGSWGKYKAGSREGGQGAHHEKSQSDKSGGEGSPVLSNTALYFPKNIMAAISHLERDMISKAQRQIPQCQDPLEKLRLQCLARGASGIKGLGRAFRIMDDNYSNCLDLEEFTKGLQNYGLSLPPEEIQDIFEQFDKNQDGTINFDEFLISVRPPMSNARRQVILEAFRKMDKTGNGVITVEDLKGVYNPKCHQKYQNGEWNERQVFQHFLENFDSPNNKDGQVTEEEFLNYYSGVSASIDSDAYFVVMMKNNWKI